ncbi:hypothetical protein SUGI_0840220 [Cryptomeria japonica]|nr:hypothetical protein SUGI_0840220 [Cryptomeria japonica]
MDGSTFLPLILTPSTIVPSGCCFNPKCFRCILYILIAIFVPPLRVAMQYEIKSKEFWICLLLTAMGDVPGIIYSIYITSKTDNSSTEKRSFFAGSVPCKRVSDLRAKLCEIAGNRSCGVLDKRLESVRVSLLPADSSISSIQI